MSILYVSDPGTSISVKENCMIAEYKNGTRHTLPIETLESITLLTKVHLSTNTIQECLSRGIPVSFFSKGGRYFGRLVSTGHVDTFLQRMQCELYDTEFAVELARRIIYAKVKNQLVVMKRYARSQGISVQDLENGIHACLKKIDTTCEIYGLTGYEGQCAKLYFEGLSRCIEPSFAFKGRSRRPPKDEFNSLISLGYSVLMNEIYNEIENRGLNPYFGFMHRDAEKHPTLASDMLEEWRAVIIDSMVMSLINGHEIGKDAFRREDDERLGCFLTKEGLQIFLKKMGKKLQTRARYLSYMTAPIAFRRGIALQLGKLAEAIRERNAEIYEPIRIR